MKKFKLLFLVITLCGVSSCKVSETTISSSLLESQNSCLKYNQTYLAEIFDGYRYARCKNNIGLKMDSIMTSISSGKELDTIFIIENCNPPLYSYYAIIWNKDNVFTLSRSGSILKRVRNEDSLKLMRLIERWDKEEIMSKSHEQPLKHYGEWPESIIASRIVMRRTKCEEVESIFFSDIDWESRDVPILFN
ncbi:MAG: hypothetical protein K5842_02155 [Bacteroidales bacterium]|nr:hypothetical protein [Bacteroidales bacterium]